MRDWSDDLGYWWWWECVAVIVLNTGWVGGALRGGGGGLGLIAFQHDELRSSGDEPLFIW